MGWFKKLLFLYIILVVVKIALVSIISAPSNFADGYIYAKMARSFFYYQNFLVHGEFNYIYPPLYPIALSSSYIFKDMNLVYFSMKVINSLISSLIIIPAWLLGKEFLSRNNIKYIYLPKIYNYSLDEKSLNIKKVYENSEVVIYSI